MWNWLRNTTLFQQLSEIASTQRRIRQTQHRNSLRLKRAAVRSRIHYELHKHRIRQANLQMQNAKLLKKYQVTHQALCVHQRREDALAALLSKHGVSVPVNGTRHEMKTRIYDNVKQLVDGHGGVVGRLGERALKDSFDKIPVKGDDTDVAIALVLGLVKEIGMTKDELAHLFNVIEQDGDHGLRATIMDALDKDP